MQFFGDDGLKQLTGMTLAGFDLTTPEGNFFFVSASLRPGATFAAVREKIDRHLQPLTSGKGDLSLAPMIGKQLAESLTTLPDPATMKGQLPPNVTPAMLEMNIGLQWGMNEFRYGALKAALARKLNSENIEEVQGVARRNLSTNECSTTTIRPF